MSRVLKIFMRGKSITQLQSVLQRMGYEIKDQKGVFGVDTRDAVKYYQKQQGLKPTGIVDEALMKQMSVGAPASAKDEKPSQDNMISNHPKELDALVRLLIAKGVFSQEEWDKEKEKVMPSSLT